MLLSTAAAHGDEVGQAYEKGVRYWAEGDPVSAVIELKNALQSKSDHVPSLILVGEIYLDQGLGDAAEDALRQALSEGADQSRVVVLLGRAMLMQRKAQQLLDEMYFSNLAPRAQADLYALRAEANVMLARINEAARELDAAAGLAPYAVAPRLVWITVYIQRGDLSAAQVKADELLEIAPDRTDVWNAAGSVAHAKGDFETALHHYGRAIEIKPRNGDARIGRLSILIDLGREEESGNDLEYFAKNLPSEPRATYLRALKLARAGDDFGSRKALADTTYVLSNFEDAVFHRDSPLLLIAALSHFGLGQMEQAVRYAGFYLTLRPNDVGARKLLADAQLRMGEPADAVKTLEDLIDRSDASLEVLSLAATAYGRYGRYVEASRLLNRAIALSGGDAQIEAHHAAMRIGAGHVDEGVAVLTRLVDDNPTHGSAALALLVTYQKEGRFREAIALGEQLHKAAPDNLSILNLLGVAYYMTEDYEGAGERFARCLSADAGFLPAAINLAKVDIAGGDLDAARPRLLSLASLRPDSGRIQLELARVERAADNPRGAIKHAEAAHALEGDNVAILEYLVGLYLSRGELQRANDISASAATSELDDLEIQAIRARVLIASADPGTARMTLRRMTDLAGRDSTWLTRIAALQSEVGDLSDAAFSLFEAIAHDANNRDAHLGLVELELRQGKSALALKSARKARERFPDDAEVRLLIGEAHFLAGDLRAALASFDEAVQLGSLSLAVVRGAHVLAMEDKHSRARTRLANWLDDHPSDHFVRRTLGEFLLVAEDFPAASRIYSKLLEATPNDATVLNNKAHVLMKLGDTMAEDYARQAIAVEPNSATYNDTLGWILVKAGRAEEALTYLREARARQYRSAEIRYHLAVCLQMLERFQESAVELQAALDFGREFDGFEEARQLQSELKDALARQS